LTILAFFKYAGLFTNVFLVFAPTAGNDPLVTLLKTIPLPIGISFYIFQGISLVVDVYRNKQRPRPELEKLVHPNFFQHTYQVSFFIAFFPQLISGPIEKAHDFIPQIAAKQFRDIHWKQAFEFLVLGYFLKSVIADNLATVTHYISYPRFMGFSSQTLITLLYGYSFQIFADFAGYSLIARGLGLLFGYRLMQNFNFPYVSRSFAEFWNRWHISLSTWLREYLYIPLGGNRQGAWKTYRNLFLVMFLGGLWHGAAWSYAVWGTAHGLLLAIERFLKNYIRPNPNWLFTKVWQTLVVFIWVSLLWLLFILPDFSQAYQYFIQMTTNFHGDQTYFISLVSKTFILSLPVICFHIHYLLPPSVKTRFVQPIRPVIFSILLFLVLTNSGEGGAFIYFQF
jgi:alginate O-acetyltransferase complex protein AlgI